MAKAQGLHLLTDRAIKAAKPGDELNDGGGLLLRVRDTGGKSFSWRGRVPGGMHPLRITVGAYPAISLKTARDMTSDIRKAVAKGEDPRKLFKPRDVNGRTLREVVARWKRHAEAQGTRSAAERERILTLHVLPRLGDKDVAAITKGDVFALLEDLRDGKGPTGVKLSAQVNRVLAALKAVISYAYSADLIASDPIAGLKRPINEAAIRHAVLLSLDDLVSIWRAADGLASLASPIVKLLVLTGLRREEITALRWDEFDEDAKTITIRAERFKGKRDHKVPLSETALAIIKAQPRYPKVPYVFSIGSGHGPFSGWRRAAENLKEAAALGHEVWHVHDIRRGVATSWGEHLNAPEELISRALGHSKSSRMGITATYEKSDRIEHLRQHIQAWDNLVQAKLNDAPSNVVPLKAG